MKLDSPEVLVCNGELNVVLPLTKPKGKVRVKARDSFARYGVPLAVRREALGLSAYVEWQIGYDLPAVAANAQKTTLRKVTFANYKKERKYAYELGEIVFHATRLKLIDYEQIRRTYSEISAIADGDTFEKRDDMQISRTNPTETKVNGLGFYRMTVNHPMLVHKFGRYDIYAETVTREKQYAVGTQPMLYVCIPATMLRFAKSPFGRTLDANETADWVVGRDEAGLSLELFRVFGMLSPKHRFDVLAIFEMLFPAVKKRQMQG